MKIVKSLSFQPFKIRAPLFKSLCQETKNASHSLENQKSINHVQASLVATFGSYGLQESAIFYKKAA